MVFRKNYTEHTRKLNVLLVEDSASAAALIRDSLLRIPGQTVVTVVPTLAGARAWLDQNTPDLMIADLVLPDGKGTQLLPVERDKGHFPIIMMTDEGSEADAVDAMKSGAVDYLVKSSGVINELPGIAERVLSEWGFQLRHRLTEDALRQSEERFRSIFFTAAAGMVVISPFKNIMQVNPAFCRFIGYSENELLSRSIHDFTHPDDKQTIIAMYEDLFSGKKSSIDCERRYIRKDGSTVWGHVSLSCIVGSDSVPAYCIALVQDISLRKALEEQLLQANEELDAFVYTVSHDLRSPLTPITGYLQYILEQHADELSEPVNEILCEVLRQGERMHLMLEDLLALATAGTVEPPSAPISGDEIMSEIMLGFSADASHCAMDVKVNGLPDLLLPRTQYHQLLDNLVGNAIRYGGGRVVVGSERSGNRVRLFVRDHGPGIPDEEKGRIFDLFYRGTTGRDKQGTGIGLAIVRKIARIHNGNAWVEDAPGGGSLFVVELQETKIPR